MSITPGNMSEQRWVECRIPVTLALVAPAVRTVVIAAWAHRREDGTWEKYDHEITPVLAIAAYQHHMYSKRIANAYIPAAAPTHAALDKLGWIYELSMGEVSYVAVIADPDCGLTDADDALGDIPNGVHQVVACPWPVEEDEERLAPTVEALRERARTKADARKGKTP